MLEVIAALNTAICRYEFMGLLLTSTDAPVVQRLLELQC